MSMLPSRKIIGEFIAVFVIGAIVGGLVMWDCTGSDLSKFMTKTNDPDVLAAKIYAKYRDEYHLSEDELARIQPLIKEMAQHIYQIRHQFGVDIISTGDDYHKKIAEQLSPEHRASYEKAMEDRKKVTSAMLQLDQTPSGQPAH